MPDPTSTPDAPAPLTDREFLLWLKQESEITSHQCETCGRADPASDCDAYARLVEHLQAALRAERDEAQPAAEAAVLAAARKCGAGRWDTPIGAIDELWAACQALSAPPAAAVEPVAPAGDREAVAPAAYQLRRKGGDWERPIRGAATARAACFGVTDVEEIRALYPGPAQPAEERAVWWTDDEIVLAHLEGLFNLINQGGASPAIMQAQVASIRAALSRARTGSEAQNG